MVVRYNHQRKGVSTSKLRVKDMKLIVKTDSTFYTVDEVKSVTFINCCLVVIFDDGSTNTYSRDSLDNGTITIVS